MGRDLESFKVPIVCLGDLAQLPPVGGSAYFTDRAPDFELTEIHRQESDSPIITMATAIRLGEY
jgi:exodeoxyribonuclease-5